MGGSPDVDLIMTENSSLKDFPKLFDWESACLVAREYALLLFSTARTFPIKSSLTKVPGELGGRGMAGILIVTSVFKCPPGRNPIF
jgi:hypothetical protein